MFVANKFCGCYLQHKISSKGLVVINLVTVPLESSNFAWVLKISEG